MTVSYTRFDTGATGVKEQRRATSKGMPRVERPRFRLRRATRLAR
jgi:hypothetical protein